MECAFPCEISKNNANVSLTANNNNSDSTLKCKDNLPSTAYASTMVPNDDLFSNDILNRVLRRIAADGEISVPVGLEVRPLRRSDFHRGFLELLAELTTVGNVDEEKFFAQFDAMKQQMGYHIVVIEDTDTSVVCGSATLHLERKFIHSAAIRGRIEDVVVSNSHRGQQLGKLLLIVLSRLSEELNCYKVSLDCKPNLVGFYEKFGYTQEGPLFLTRRLKD